MKRRLIVCPLIENDGAYLFCKMPADRGVFPGKWALSGGGVEVGERLEEALRREIREELGEELEITEMTPWTFRDDIRVKTYRDGSSEEIYMVYLLFNCRAANRAITLNDEFEEYAWARPEDFASFDLNEETRRTLAERGLLKPAVP